MHTAPSDNPTTDPTNIPTTDPTTDLTLNPSIDPTKYPSNIPSRSPTRTPITDTSTISTYIPTMYPSKRPTTDQKTNGNAVYETTSLVGDNNDENDSRSDNQPSILSDEYLMQHWYYLAAIVSIFICILCSVVICWIFVHRIKDYASETDDRDEILSVSTTGRGIIVMDKENEDGNIANDIMEFELQQTSLPNTATPQSPSHSLIMTTPLQLDQHPSNLNVEELNLNRAASSGENDHEIRSAGASMYSVPKHFTTAVDEEEDDELYVKSPELTKGDTLGATIGSGNKMELLYDADDEN